MQQRRRLIFWATALVLCAAWLAQAQREPIPVLSRDPYAGAILCTADGEVLWEDQADTPVYPASTIKLMNLLLILEAADRGEVRLEDPVRVTAEAANMGGTQVFLKEGEVFSVRELLYAMMVQSANDAAVALAQHVAGTRANFVSLMNRRASELNMRRTRFHSVHGLPPAKGQQPDVSTPRDIARLCVALLKRNDVLPFTSVIRRPFRSDSANPFIMENHNRLLSSFEGCDGLKTGYIRAGGYSIAATAAREGHRVIAVVMGSLSREARDAKTRELLAMGLAEMSKRPKHPEPPVVVPSPPPAPPAEAASPPPQPKRRWLIAVVLLAFAAVVFAWLKRPRFNLR